MGHDPKRDVVDLVLDRHPVPEEPFNPAAAFAPMQRNAAVGRGLRARPFLKIQDGCNAFCTYCIVPHARGRSRSLPEQTALAAVERLQAAGCREVVLTGIHLGIYGKDLAPPTSLLQLLRRIRERQAVQRVRLSSIEPLEMTADLIDFIACARSGPGRVCAHVHIPLQSGDDRILEKMKRPYSRQAFKDVVTEVHRRLPEAAIGVDTLIGFPGETRTAFDHTYELIAELPITYLHVFPFSARRGTPAYHYSNAVEAAETRQRCRKMRKLGIKKKTEFYKNFIHKQLEVLVETVSPDTGSAAGTSDNYIPVHIDSPQAPLTAQQLVWVRGESLGPDGRLHTRTRP
jgi:threonylcarbamoyladenosine tRNA methylthiotransferase MtaB